MKLRITISKYHSWYLCEISPQIMPLLTQTQGTGEVATIITILVAHSFLLNAPSFPLCWVPYIKFVCNSIVYTRLNAVLEYVPQMKATLPNNAASNLKHAAFIQRLNKQKNNINRWHVLNSSVLLPSSMIATFLNEKRSSKADLNFFSCGSYVIFSSDQSVS